MMTSRRKGAGADEAPGAQGGERAGAKNPFFAKRIQRSLIGLRQWEEDDVAVERNKKRGGRPGTPDGKQWARRNAIKHGVFAQTPVLPLLEDERDRERLRQDVLDWFFLDGEFQEPLP